MKRTTPLLAALLVFLAHGQARAVPIEFISNGGFETGTFAGWTVVNSGSGNWAINNGSFDPAGPGLPLPPITGNFDAVSFQFGPGQHILFQQVIPVPFGITSATLSWSDRIRNHATTFSDPNQEWRMLVKTGTGALIQQIFSTNPGDPLIQIGPNNRLFDVTALLQGLAGQTIRLSWEQEDNLFFFNATLDNASLLVNVSEPSTLWLGLTAFGLLALRLRTRGSRRTSAAR